MFLPLALLVLSAQQGTARLSGYVRQAASREAIRHARVSVDSLGARGESNEDGFYVLRLPHGTHRLSVRAVGYAPLDTTVELTASLTLDLNLSQRAVVLQDLSVQGKTTRSIDPELPEMSISRLNVETVKQLPVVLGEVDPIRTLSLLPGVSTVSDFTTGFSVRGGSVDQNLILLDESTIFNPAHIFGFLSVFNADAIDDVTLYKGAAPPRYGGRLSSVLDIRQREGNANHFAGRASLGLLASRLSLEGPLPGHRGSYLVAGRRTYADLFLRLSKDPDINRNVAYFYDLNLKANLKLGSRGSLMASGYFGRDQFGVADRFGAGWGNEAAGLRWNHAFGGKVFSKVSVAYSDYDYLLKFLATGPSLEWTSHIRSLDLKIDELLYFNHQNSLELGVQGTFFGFEPATITPVGDSPVKPTTSQRRYATAPSFYLGHRYEGGRWALSYGARLSAFRRRGPATIYQYRDGAPVVYDSLVGHHVRGTVVDSVRYGDGQTISTFAGIEPRLSVRFSVGEGRSLKASYSRMRQYLQLISNTASPTPLDIWEPVGPYSRAQVGDQVALGYAALIAGQRYQISVEGFYKWLRNVTDFVDGADLTLNDRIETEILRGQGRAYGLELSIQKPLGRLSGWVSYTLGKSEQRIPGVSPGDPGLNGGQWYPTAYHKTHNLAVVGLYQLSERWSLGSTFVLSSGLPTTYPESRYRYDDFLIVEYGSRNAQRLPAYHRLDLTLTRTGKHSQLQFGIFNVYNRFNAQSLTFRQSEANPLVTEAVQLSIFGLLPSVSYSFRF